MKGPLDALGRAQPVHIPLGEGKRRMLAIIGRVFVKRPIGNPVTCRIEPSHQTDACRRTHATSIGLGKLHALVCQTLHVGRSIALIECHRLGVERHRGVLPAHVVDQEEDNVWTLCMAHPHGEQQPNERRAVEESHA